MRSATNNRFLNVWVYEPPGGGCSPSNNVWTLAEVAAQQTSGGDPGNPVGSYFWPIRPWHRPNGPSQKIGDYCGSGYRQSPADVDIYCNVSASACIGAEQTYGCPDSEWDMKLGVQWEYSANEGATWFRLPRGGVGD